MQNTAAAATSGLLDLSWGPTIDQGMCFVEQQPDIHTLIVPRIVCRGWEQTPEEEEKRSRVLILSQKIRQNAKSHEIEPSTLWSRYTGVSTGQLSQLLPQVIFNGKI